LLHLIEVDESNWRLGLKVSTTQESYVSDSMKLLARAYAYRNLRSKAYVICNNEIAVGMALYYDSDSLSAYNFSQLFIDERYQGRGYGIKASQMLLELMKLDEKFNKVVLCFIEGNNIAKKLYEKLGFELTGDRDEDKIIMQKFL
jgi:diamine N-acetyltransferase